MSNELFIRRGMCGSAHSAFPAARGLVAALLAALLLAACGERGDKAPEGQPGVETVPEAPVPLTQYIETDTLDSYDYLSSNFTLSISGMSANGVMRMHHDDRVWVSVSKVFELGRALFTKDSVFAYVKMTGKYVRCSYADLRAALGAYVDYRTVQGVLTGKGSNTNLVQVEYDQFDTVNGEEFPLFLDLTLNDKRLYATAQMRLSRLRLGDSTARLQFPFSIPPSAQPLWPALPSATKP